MSIPALVPASQLDVFKIYDGSEICEAVLYNHTIMKRLKVLPIDYKREAYRFACSVGQRHSTLLSLDAEACKVWVDVRYCDDVQQAVQARQSVLRRYCKVSSVVATVLAR